jgi:hypothetical protein
MVTYADLVQEVQKCADAHRINHEVSFLVKDESGIWGKEITLSTLADLLLQEYVSRMFAGRPYLFVHQISAEVLDEHYRNNAMASGGE